MYLASNGKAVIVFKRNTVDGFSAGMIAGFPPEQARKRVAVGEASFYHQDGGTPAPSPDTKDLESREHEAAELVEREQDRLLAEPGRRGRRRLSD